MIDLNQRIQGEQVISVKIVMFEELISVMNKARYYLDSTERLSFKDSE